MHKLHLGLANRLDAPEVEGSHAEPLRRAGGPQNPSLVCFFNAQLAWMPLPTKLEALPPPLSRSRWVVLGEAAIATG